MQFVTTLVQEMRRRLPSNLKILQKNFPAFCQQSTSLHKKAINSLAGNPPHPHVILTSVKTSGGS